MTKRTFRKIQLGRRPELERPRTVAPRSERRACHAIAHQALKSLASILASSGAEPSTLPSILKEICLRLKPRRKHTSGDETQGGAPVDRRQLAGHREFSVLRADCRNSEATRGRSSIRDLRRVSGHDDAFVTATGTRCRVSRGRRSETDPDSTLRTAVE